MYRSVRFARLIGAVCATGAAVALAGCASGATTSDDGNGKPRPRPHASRNFGIQITVPAGWDARMFLKRPGDLPEVHVASFRLPANEAGLEFGKAASRMMRANDVRIRLMELPSIQAGRQGFNRTSLPITIRRSDLERSPWVPREHAYASRRFAVRGRPFSLGVEFGRKPPTLRQWQQVRPLVSSLEIDARPELDPRQWRALRRPLRFPRVAGRRPCPRSSSARTAARVSWPLGPGPVYPALGSPNGDASLEDDPVQNGWYLHKTLWAISPRYRGPILIRGARVDGSGALRFNFRLTREFKLHRLPAKAASRWGYVSSRTALRGPGCYAFQVDGSTFSTVIIFEAKLAASRTRRR